MLFENTIPIEMRKLGDSFHEDFSSIIIEDLTLYENELFGDPGFMCDMGFKVMLTMRKCLCATLEESRMIMLLF